MASLLFFRFFESFPEPSFRRPSGTSSQSSALSAFSMSSCICCCNICFSRSFRRLSLRNSGFEWSVSSWFCGMRCFGMIASQNFSSSTSSSISLSSRSGPASSSLFSRFSKLATTKLFRNRSVSAPFAVSSPLSRFKMLSIFSMKLFFSFLSSEFSFELELSSTFCSASSDLDSEFFFSLFTFSPSMLSFDLFSVVSSAVAVAEMGGPDSSLPGSLEFLDCTAFDVSLF
mmetsp:Transcript_11498/g.28318  ORF Transcript_11498/g.28318 Transcript_11498/m.28318 type:complete len:229 (-) Transcript_11498:3380-4066(-)